MACSSPRAIVAEFEAGGDAEGKRGGNVAGIVPAGQPGRQRVRLPAEAQPGPGAGGIPFGRQHLYVGIGSEAV